MINTTLQDILNMKSKYIRPSYLIIGGVKCGTSSLYRYMNEHPNILPCKVKEPRYHVSKNPYKWISRRNWYFSQFPETDHIGKLKVEWFELLKTDRTIATSFEKEKLPNVHYITGEASAGVFAKGIPAFVKRSLPQAKLIILLREPTERFISHYNMFLRYKGDGTPKYQSLPNDLLTFVKSELELYKKNKQTQLLYQGLYCKLIKKWSKWFDEAHIKIVKTSNMDNPDTMQEILNELFVWLGLEAHEVALIEKRFNKAPRKIIDEESIRLLNEFYARPNEALQEELGIYV